MKMKLRFSDFNTRFKILAGTIAPLTLILVIAGISAYGLSTTQKISGWVEHTQNVLGKSDSIVAAGVDMETGMRGYLLAGKEEFLDPYKAGQTAAFEEIAKLQETVSDNPKQVERLGEAANTLRAWQKDVTEPQIELRRAIGSAETMNDMAALIGKAEGKSYFDKFRAQVGTFIEREAKLLDAREQAGNTKWVVHTYKVIQTANAIIAAAVDMETGMRGYLLAGKEDFLEPYTNGSNRFQKLTATLKKTVSDNPAQVKLLGDAQATIADWKSIVTEKQIGLRRQIGHAKTMDDLADLVGQAKGKAYFDKFRQLLADFRAEEERLMGIRQTERNATVDTTYMSLGIGTLLAFLFGTGLAWFVGSGIANPIRLMTDAMQRLAQGDTTTEVEGAERGDEIGKMASAVQVFKDNMIRAQTLEAEQEQQKARTEEEKRAMMTKMADEFDASVGGIVENVASASSELQSTAQNMASISEETSSQAMTVSAASEEATTNVQTVAAAAEELSSSIGEINQRVAEGAQASRQAVDEATETGAQMQTLAETADRIGTVVGMISDIAAQTNLLALNATIEAARAGEMGRGFAVVASEVKDLASQTGNATEEIGGQIQDLQDATKKASVSMESIIAKISQVNETSTAIATAIEEQGAVTQEISRNVHEAATGTASVSENIASVTQASQEAGTASSQVNTRASELNEQSVRLKAEVENFVAQVRTG